LPNHLFVMADERNRNRGETAYVFVDRNNYPAAKAPFYGSAQAAGADVYIVAETKMPVKPGQYRDPRVTWYTTGVVVEPPAGHHFELVGRSSLSGTGYQLANCLGVLDEDYRGEILCAVRKIDPAAPALLANGPFKLGQLVLRKTCRCRFVEVNHKDELATTARGTGGFGSTDNV